MFELIILAFKSLGPLIILRSIYYFDEEHVIRKSKFSVLFYFSSIGISIKETQTCLVGVRADNKVLSHVIVNHSRSKTAFVVC